jgi:Spy/CpxP family protein refolding chaperone
MKHFRILKQAVIAAGLLAFCSLPATLRAQETPQSGPQGGAQGQQTAHPRHGGEHERELAKLNLSDDQKAQVNTIHENAKTQADAVKSDASLSDAQKQAKLHAIHEAAHQQMKQVFTPEQRQQLKADEKAHRGEQPQGGQAPPQQ